MKTYLARMVFQVNWEAQHEQVVYEEQLRLFIANDKLEAFTQANVNGHTEEGSFPFSRGGAVNWKFLGLTSLEELGNIHSGLLLDSSARHDAHPDETGKLLKAQIRRFNGQLEIEAQSLLVH